MKVNETLKKLRATKNLSQNDLANLLEVSLSSYQKYEREKNSVIPSLEVLIRVADFYQVSVDYLLGRETGASEPLEQLAGKFNLTALEKKLLDNYVSLPADMRAGLMDFLQKSVREAMEEAGG